MIYKFSEFERLNEETKPSKIYKNVMFDDYEIRIGRNSQVNDILTFEYANDNDLWFHVSGYPGSHVVIKVKENQETPNKVILEASRLAIYNSKAKGKGLVKVVYTERKNVTKTDKHNPGQVSVDYSKSKFIKIEVLKKYNINETYKNI